MCVGGGWGGGGSLSSTLFIERLFFGIYAYFFGYICDTITSRKFVHLFWGVLLAFTGLFSKDVSCFGQCSFFFGQMRDISVDEVCMSLLGVSFGCLFWYNQVSFHRLCLHFDFERADF